MRKSSVERQGEDRDAMDRADNSDIAESEGKTQVNVGFPQSCYKMVVSENASGYELIRCVEDAGRQGTVYIRES